MGLLNESNAAAYSNATPIRLNEGDAAARGLVLRFAFAGFEPNHDRSLSQSQVRCCASRHASSIAIDLDMFRDQMSCKSACSSKCVNASVCCGDLGCHELLPALTVVRDHTQRFRRASYARTADGSLDADRGMSNGIDSNRDDRNRVRGQNGLCKSSNALWIEKELIPASDMQPAVTTAPKGRSQVLHPGVLAKTNTAHASAQNRNLGCAARCLV